MSHSPIIDDPRNSRDEALDALARAITAIEKIIAQTSPPNPELTRYYQELMKLRAAVWAAATNAVLAQPSVIAATATLNSFSAQMKTTAQELTETTNVLSKTATVLALGQQFSAVLARAQNA